MTSTGFDADTAPRWSWPTSVPSAAPAGTAKSRHRIPGHFEDDDPPAPVPTRTTKPVQPDATPEGVPSGTQQSQQQQRQRQRNYGPRTCRICLEIVYPSYHLPSENLPGFLQSRAPHVTYDSEDPASGRLLRPCKCKGSARYVHENCLNLWRKSDPAMGNRNYWVCPTCGFQYRLERMSWGRWINNTFTQIGLTMAILLLAVFVLGFVADPIINLYLDPYDTLTYGVEKITLDEEGDGTWVEHFLKGLASLGLLGFVKVLLALSPWQWWNVRSSGIMNVGNGRQGTGRDRIAGISSIVIIMGIGTFVWAVYKGVRAWSRRTLELASERVMDVPLDDDDSDEGDEDTDENAPHQNPPESRPPENDR